MNQYQEIKIKDQYNQDLYGIFYKSNLENAKANV